MMSLRRRLFLTICLVVLVGFLSIAHWVRGELKNSYVHVAEEILFDFAHLLAAHIENKSMSKEAFTDLQKMFEVKNKSNLEMYATDANGKVIFSTKVEEVGADYSKWNDVYKTLRGQYGARSTPIDPNDSRTSVYYVAAPILADSKIVGAVTVYKTESSILVFWDKAMNKMFAGGFLSVLVLALMGGLILIWITLPIERLRRYALDVSEGRRAVLPQSNIKEVRHLGEAFDKMRVSLEGKKTIEKYTQILTHELKSPMTAIKGAAELCLEEMDAQQRNSFLKNIIEEADRSHAMLEQLLKIAAIESKRQIESPTKIDLLQLLHETKEALTGLWKPKKIEININGKTESLIEGDSFLLFQSFRNVLQNAIEFSSTDSSIDIRLSEDSANFKIEFMDYGAGIPDFAKDKIFEKFYSLERPDTKRKSSGLGLSFVKEAVELHGGRVEVISPVDKAGTKVTIELSNNKTNSKIVERN